MRFLVQGVKPVEVAKQYFWLAWQACGSPMGMGFLQNRPTATIDDVWNNVNTNGDYAYNDTKPNEPYGDYVFGRMMKTGLRIDGDIIQVRDDEPRCDYQSWCGKYATYGELLEAAAKAAGAALVPVNEATVDARKAASVA